MYVSICEEDFRLPAVYSMDKVIEYVVDFHFSTHFLSPVC